MSIFVRTEQLSQQEKETFNKASVGDLATDVITIINNGDFSNKFVIRRQITFGKWRLAKENFDNGNTLLAINEKPEILDSFLKILYGHEVKLTNEQIFLVWEFADRTGYVNSHNLRQNWEQNLGNLQLESKLQLLCNDRFPDKASIVEKLSIKEIRLLCKNHLSELSKEVLASMNESLAQRYKTGTDSLKATNDSLNKKIKELELKLKSTVPLSGAQSTSSNQTNTIDPMVAFANLFGDKTTSFGPK